MRELFATVALVARSDATVLVQGETGSGKELVAEAIHASSPRKGGPFVVLDCAATPANLFENELFGHEKGAFTDARDTTRGVFEAASGGTLFLDEIGELPVDVQPKLLRAVQTRKIRRVGGAKTVDCDVRIIAATNRDLTRAVRRASFRADLYYRIAVITLDVPPLRDHPEDIPALVAHFLEQLGYDPGAPLTEDFLRKAMTHDWLGNVRELRSAVERAVLMPDRPTCFTSIRAEGTASHRCWAEVDINTPFKTAKKRIMDEFERRFMRALLERHNWNISAAARATGLDRNGVYKLLDRLQLRRDGEP